MREWDEGGPGLEQGEAARGQVKSSKDGSSGREQQQQQQRTARCCSGRRGAAPTASRLTMHEHHPGTISYSLHFISDCCAVIGDDCTGLSHSRSAKRCERSVIGSV